MHRSVKARFEGGVLRPLSKLDLPEGSTVDIVVAPPPAWEVRLETLLRRVRERVRDLSPDEIEVEITRAADEARAERLARP